MDPLGGIRSSAAQGKAMQKGVTGKVKRAKGMQAKAAGFGKSVVFYLLTFFLFGILLGLCIYLPYYGVDMPFATAEGDQEVAKVNMVSTVFICLSIIFLSLGIWHLNRAIKKIDWFDDFRFGPEMGFTLGTAFLAALGFFLMHRFGHVIPWVGSVEPKFDPMANAFAALFASTAIWFIVPFLIRHLYQRAMLVEDKHYPLWYFPKKYNEKEPVWSKPVVHLHMRFLPDRREGRTKLIETKLPQQWNFGQGVYLFMEDYNEHRSPDAPIKELRRDDNSLGWLFSVPQKLGPIKIGKRYLDPELSVEENQINENAEIQFHRINRPVN